MEESSTLKLIIEKGPREGEALEYSSRSVIKIGRVVRGNTIGIKDAGISSKHICIQFDNEMSKWTLTDLDSSNGTILNGETLLPNVPSALNDSDCIKIGELTSISVKIGVQFGRNSRRQAKSGATAAIEKGQSGLGLEVDGDLGENAVEEPVQKRNLRSRAKKVVDSKNEVESLSSKRTLRSSKKEEKVDFNPKLNQILIDTNSNVRETSDQVVPIERKVTRGRKKKSPVQPSEPADIVVPVDVKKTRGRKRLPVEPLEELQTNGSVQVDEAEKPTSTQKDHEEIGGLEENLDTINESAQEPIVDQSLVKGSSEAAALQIPVKTGHDDSRWEDLEKMTLGDFFDYLEYHLPKEIREKTEESILQLQEKAKIYNEVRLQIEKDKGKQVMD